MARIYFLRHGQTDMNIHHMLQGRTDTHLNETGREQARAAHDFMVSHGIRPDRIITSPLVRTIETAEIATGRPRDLFFTEPLLIEMCFGKYEGTKVREMDPEFYDYFFHKPDQCAMPQDAETFHDLYDRAREFLKKMEFERENNDDTILYVSHGAFLHAIMGVMNEYPLCDFWKYPIDNCAILTVGTDNDGILRMEHVFDGFAKRD